MERNNSTMRAARHVIGAGTFAAAMLAMTAASASAQDCAGSEAAGAFCGHVFTDITGGTNNAFDPEEGIGGVPVVMIYADGPLAGTEVGGSPTESDSTCPGEFCGYYSFEVFTPGNYLICIVTDGESNDCRTHADAVPVTLGSTAVVTDFEVGDSGEEEVDPNDIWGVGTGTPGYWKNHPEAWPVASITIGTGAGAITYTVSQAISKMGKVSGDKTYSMFAALVSAILNTGGLPTPPPANAPNNPVCISATIASANTWMGAHPVGSNVKASSAAWAEAQEWHQRLDDYNNGKLCAPHRN